MHRLQLYLRHFGRMREEIRLLMAAFSRSTFHTRRRSAKDIWGRRLTSGGLLDWWCNPHISHFFWWHGPYFVFIPQNQLISNQIESFCFSKQMQWKEWILFQVVCDIPLWNLHEQKWKQKKRVTCFYFKGGVAQMVWQKKFRLNLILQSWSFPKLFPEWNPKTFSDLFYGFTQKRQKKLLKNRFWWGIEMFLILTFFNCFNDLKFYFNRKKNFLHKLFKEVW